MAVSIDKSDARRVVVVETPGEWLEEDLAREYRVCSVCGRGQHELQQVGHSLRFLCPDEVCTECLIDDDAAA